jgi:hypothetical protein
LLKLIDEIKVRHVIHFKGNTTVFYNKILKLENKSQGITYIAAYIAGGGY